MKITWKDIPDYEGIYQANNIGQIRTVPNKVTVTEKHGIRHWKTRILKGRGDNKITGKRVCLWKNGKAKDWLVARLVAITFLGKPSSNANTVNHINGNRLDNRIENLEWLSLGDNIRHAFKTGLMPTKKIIIFKDKYKIEFCSLSDASIYLGRNKGYISNRLKRNKTELKSINGEIYNYKLQNS